jgi:hypothetical protein
VQSFNNRGMAALSTATVKRRKCPKHKKIAQEGESQPMNKLTYTTVGDYQFPNLTITENGMEGEIHIGIWGQRRLNHLKEHRTILYTNLLLSGKLWAHLREIDATARERLECLMRRMMESEGITEQLKAENAMLWVGKVNNIRSRVEEIIRAELIYS